MTRSVRHKYLILIFVTLVLIAAYHVQKDLRRPRFEKMVFYEGPEDLGSRDPDVSCIFPLPHPLDPSILSYLEPGSKVRCRSSVLQLTYVDESGFLRLNSSGFKTANYEMTDLSCYYSVITLKDDFNYEFGDWVPLVEPVRPGQDFVMVKCRGYAGLVVYTNFHACVQRKPSVRKYKNDNELSVAVIGLDSMSRLNFMRQMPKSYRLLKNKLNATMMLGFNKVGENTFPNVIPMLTGCPPHWSPYNHFKGWPLIWNEWQDAGAATTYTEDLPKMSMFDYMADGIIPQPTDHYMRTFWMAVEESTLYKMSSPYCLGPTPNHIIYFNYLKSFFRTYKDSPAFMFSLLNEPTHDYVNTAGMLDDDFVDFINSSYHEGLLERTIVIVLGDHGNRIDSFRITKIGQIEDRMPLVSIILPNWVNKIHPHWKRNLEINSKRLASSYDLHATFKEIFNSLENSGQVKVRHPIDPHFLKNQGPGLSLLKPLPTNRGCKDAGIKDEFCVCSSKDETSLQESDTRTQVAVTAVIKHMNKDLLAGLERNCSMHAVSKLERAEFRTLVDGSAFIRLTLWTEPGHGLFEASVRLSSIENVSNSHTSVSSLLRINRYGRQSDCLPDYIIRDKIFLKGVCYCIR